MSQFALAQMKAACERAPEHEPYRMALGVAQYRKGKSHKERVPEALSTLSQCNQDHPTTLSFLAMAQHQLGQIEKARAALARMQEVMKDEQWSKNPDAQSFFREATELIEGRLAEPKP